MKKKRVIAWWSGGVTSALACLWAVRTFKDVAIVFIDTKNEHPDTHRFLDDCESMLYNQKIEILTNKEYSCIQDVWRKYLSLNTAHGAICSAELKRKVREEYQDLTRDYAQVFGFDADEMNRHFNMRKNYPEINVISPMAEQGFTKEMVFKEWQRFSINVPEAYKLGYRNNNCFCTMCVQGGIGYRKKVQQENQEAFNAMADMEHYLTNQKGQPVTILKDQSKGGGLVFLKPHPDYGFIKDISMMKGRKVEPLIECHGFCSTDDK